MGRKSITGKHMFNKYKKKGIFVVNDNELQEDEFGNSIVNFNKRTKLYNKYLVYPFVNGQYQNTCKVCAVIDSQLLIEMYNFIDDENITYVIIPLNDNYRYYILEIEHEYNNVVESQRESRLNKIILLLHVSLPFLAFFILSILIYNSARFYNIPYEIMPYQTMITILYMTFIKNIFSLNLSTISIALIILMQLYVQLVDKFKYSNNFKSMKVYYYSLMRFPRLYSEYSIALKQIYIVTFIILTLITLTPFINSLFFNSYDEFLYNYKKEQNSYNLQYTVLKSIFNSSAYPQEIKTQGNRELLIIGILDNTVYYSSLKKIYENIKKSKNTIRLNYCENNKSNLFKLLYLSRPVEIEIGHIDMIKNSSNLTEKNSKKLQSIIQNMCKNNTL